MSDEKEINGIKIVKGGEVVGVITDFEPKAVYGKVFEIMSEHGDEEYVPGNFSTYGTPMVLRIIKTLIYEDMLKRANAQIFFNRYESLMDEETRREFMEKYGVEIDKDKVEKEKQASKGSGSKSPESPHRNVPKDPDKGTEPFEKRPGKED